MTDKSNKSDYLLISVLHQRHDNNTISNALRSLRVFGILFI